MKPRSRDWLFMAIYFIGCGFSLVAFFPRALHLDVRLSAAGPVHATGRIMAITGTRSLTVPSRRATRHRQSGPPAGSPVRLHRYDFEFTTADGHPQYGFSFAGGGLYALGEKVDVSYDSTKPELCRAAGTYLEPAPWAAVIAIFPAFGFFVLARMLWRNRRVAARPRIPPA